MSNPLKSSLYAALWAFLGSFAPALLKFTSAIAQWSDSQGASAFPKFSILGYAAVSALVAAFSGLIAFGVRTAQSYGYLPGNAPQYGKVIDVLPVAEAVVVQDPGNDVPVEPLQVAAPIEPPVAPPVAEAPEVLAAAKAEAARVNKPARPKAPAKKAAKKP